jgi:hypothetical protein
MAFMTLSLLGVSIISNAPNGLNTLYNKVVLKGGQSIFDKLLLLDYAMTDAELDALTPTDFYTWNTDTLLYAEFTNNLQAGALMVNSTIDSWEILRYETDSTYPVTLETALDGAETSLTDYTPILGKTYYYKILPVTSGAVVSAIQSNTVTVDYDNWILIDSVTGDSFYFTIGLESGDRPQVTFVTEYNGFTETPAVFQAPANYMTGQIKCYLGYMDTNDEYIDTPDYYNLLKAFIVNGNEKYLKDRKGNIWRVATKSLVGSFDDKIGEQPTTISFSYTEVGAV